MTIRAVNDQWDSVEVRQAASLTVPPEQGYNPKSCHWISALYGAYVVADIQSDTLVWNWKDNHRASYGKKPNEVSDSEPSSIHTFHKQTKCPWIAYLLDKREKLCDVQCG